MICFKICKLQISGHLFGNKQLRLVSDIIILLHTVISYANTLSVHNYYILLTAEL